MDAFFDKKESWITYICEQFVTGNIVSFDGICDDCGSSLITRSDDNEETFKIRFDNYMKETRPEVYKAVRKTMLGTLMRLRGKAGHKVLIAGYTVAQKLFDFN